MLQIQIVSLVLVLITKSEKGLVSVLLVLVNYHFWVISSQFSGSFNRLRQHQF